MSGLCVVGGVSDAVQRAKKITSCIARFGQAHSVYDAGSGFALGCAYHQSIQSEQEVRDEKDGIVVAVHGEMYGDDAVLPFPAKRIRELYLSDNLDRIAHINGSFSSVLIDVPRRRTVLMSDRYGSRPLFYWQNAKGFVVASSLAALLLDDRLDRRLSMQGLMELISYQRTVADHTQYSNIYAMTGSQIIVMENGKIEKKQTWRLRWRQTGSGEKETAHLLAQAITRAARRRSSDGARTGILLSGGLDARWVVSATRASGHNVSCCTTGPYDNAEVSVARAIANASHFPFHFYECHPSELSATLDRAVSLTHGLFVAPMNFMSVLPDMAKEHDVLISGHGLDYTLRGYYLPCVMVRIAGSVTRLPILRKIPDGTPATVEKNIRVGIKEYAIKSILLPKMHEEYGRRRLKAMEDALALADIDNPYNAWDAFILHCLGRHYAYSDFVAMTNYVEHRTLAFDHDVMDIYLSMSPECRASGKVAQAAMMETGKDLMALPDANSGFSARYSFLTQASLIFGRAMLRKAGIVAREQLPHPTMSHGSWANYAELFRSDPIFVEKLKALHHNGALMDSGIFSSDGVKGVVSQHLEGKDNHTKLLHELLTLASWFENNSYTGTVNDN